MLTLFCHSQDDEDDEDEDAKPTSADLVGLKVRGMAAVEPGNELSVFCCVH
jgi:hypothetical protein